MIGLIRRGTYGAARVGVQELWKVICLDVMPVVVPLYKKDVQLQTHLLEVVSAPQEVFVLWLLQECYATWEDEWKKDKEYTDKHGAKPPRRSKPKGQRNFATAKSKEYLDLLTVVDDARKNEDSGRGWETPLFDAAVAKYVTDGSGSQQGLGDSTARASKRQKVIFPVVGL